MDFEIESAVTVLSRTPGTLRAMLDGLPDAWTRATEGDRTWSPFDVLGHLIHGERTDWIPRARIILAAGESRPFDPFDRFAQMRESEGKSLESLLAEFARLREENLAELDRMRIGLDDLARAGTHPDLGRVTLGELLATWVVHDLDHVAQIARTMARQYETAVGPWRAYLSVLR